MRRTKMVVVDVFKLLRDGKSFTKRGMELKRSAIAMDRDFVDSKNATWKTCGLWHEIDEDATDYFYELRESRRQGRKKAVATQKRFSDALSATLESSKTITPLEIEEEPSAEEVDELAELRAAYKEKFDKRAFHGWDIDKLKEKLA